MTVSARVEVFVCMVCVFAVLCGVSACCIWWCERLVAVVILSLRESQKENVFSDAAVGGGCGSVLLYLVV